MERGHEVECAAASFPGNGVSAVQGSERSIDRHFYVLRGGEQLAHRRSLAAALETSGWPDRVQIVEGGSRRVRAQWELTCVTPDGRRIGVWVMAS